MASTCRAGRATSTGRRCRSQGANFVYIKATDGGDHLDPMFRKNWREAGQAGLKRGAYHFFYWCRVASEQADWFIRHVPRVAGALPPVIDVEYNGQSSCKRRMSPEKRREKMQVFMDRLEAPLRPAADHLYRAGFLSRQSARPFPELSFLAARGGAASLEGLSRPQLRLLAIFGLRPVAGREGQDRPQRVQWHRSAMAPMGRRRSDGGVGVGFPAFIAIPDGKPVPTFPGIALARLMLPGVRGGLRRSPRSAWRRRRRGRRDGGW